MLSIKRTSYKTISHGANPEESMLPVFISGEKKPRYYVPPTLKQLSKFPDTHSFVHIMKKWYEDGYKTNGWILCCALELSEFEAIYNFYFYGKCAQWHRHRAIIYDNLSEEIIKKRSESSKMKSTKFLEIWHDERAPTKDKERDELVSGNIPDFGLNLSEICDYYHHYKRAHKILLDIGFIPPRRNNIICTISEDTLFNVMKHVDNEQFTYHSKKYNRYEGKMNDYYIKNLLSLALTCKHLLVYYQKYIECCVDNCSAKKEVMSNFCEKHTCQFPDCVNRSVVACAYCQKHLDEEEELLMNNLCKHEKCNWYQDCDLHPWKHNIYCKIHKCEVEECRDPALDWGFNYCRSHRCRNEYCENRRTDTSEYCLHCSYK